MRDVFEQQVISWTFEERCFLQPLLLYSKSAARDPATKKAFTLLEADLEFFNKKVYGLPQKNEKESSL